MKKYTVIYVKDSVYPSATEVFAESTEDAIEKTNWLKIQNGCNSLLKVIEH